MFEDVLAWTVVIGLLVGVVAAYINPSTRPYAKKYGWLLIAIAAVLAGYVLLRRRAGSADSIVEGRDIAARNATALDTIVDAAYEKASWADADLARKRLESEADVTRYDAELETVKKIDDSLERRKALIRVVESQ